MGKIGSQRGRPSTTLANRTVSTVPGEEKTALSRVSRSNICWEKKNAPTRFTATRLLGCEEGGFSDRRTKPASTEVVACVTPSRNPPSLFRDRRPRSGALVETPGDEAGSSALRHAALVACHRARLRTGTRCCSV